MTLNYRTTIAGPARLLTRPPYVVRCVGSVDADMVASFERQFARAVASGQAVIPVVVHSDGGNLTDALAIVALMKTSPVRVSTIVHAEALSAAVLIASAGTDRYVGPYATLMLHQVSLSGVSGSAREVAVESHELHRCNTAAMRLIAENVGRPPPYFADLVAGSDGDLYMDAAAALHHRLATHIGTPHLEVRVHVTLRLANERRWTDERVLDVGAAPSHKRRRVAASDDESDSDA